MSESPQATNPGEAVQPAVAQTRSSRRWPGYLVAALLFLLAAYAVLAIAATPAPDHPFFEGLPDRPLVIAHQGGAGLWPSNTMFAFERAAEMGVDVLEMDMHRTADGVLVLMHDDTVDRTTDGSGPINSFTLAELKALDAGYYFTADDGQTYPYRGMGITVPTLEEVLTTFPGWRLNIEIKPDDATMGAPFCQMLRDHGMAEQVLVGSFHPESMEGFRQACPEVAISAGENEVRTMYVLNLLYLGRLHSASSHAMQVPETRDNLTVTTPRFVRASHGRNMDVHVWTVNETEDMVRILDMDVDGIITDYPDRLLALLGG